MPVTIDPETFVISVPKDYLTLVQATPNEIYELDTNAFRLTLKDLEDNQGIIIFPKTHDHNTEVYLGGITFARTVEILAPYTITFEDGLYAINFINSNNNIGDVTNVNSVSIRPNNSAGLISSPDIEYAAFNGGVTMDVDNGFSGTVFPTGTARKKSNNMADTLIIAAYRGFNKIYAHSDLTLTSTAEVSRFIIQGENHVNTTLTVEDGAITDHVTFTDITLQGVLDGDSSIENCIVRDITYLNGHIHGSSLAGTIQLNGNKDAYMVNCTQLDMDIMPAIDMGGSGQDLVMPNYSGLLTITNLTGGNQIGIGLNQGNVILDSTTVTSGTIIVSGIGSLVDENGERILSGEWNGGVTIMNQLLNRDTISEATGLANFVYIDAVNGTPGTEFPIGTKRTPSSNLEDAVLIAEDRGTQELYIHGDYNFPPTTYITDYKIYGEGPSKSTFTFEAGCILALCEVFGATLSGNETGIIGITDCVVNDLGSVGLVPSSQTVTVTRTLLDGTITFPANYSGLMTVVDCYSNIPGNSTPIVDLGGSTALAQLRNYTGGIEFINGTGGNVMSVDLVSGNLKISNTCTDAVIVARGTGKMIESETGDVIPTGIWNGGVTIVNEAINSNTVTTEGDSIGASLTSILYANDRELARAIRRLTNVTAANRHK